MNNSEKKYTNIEVDGIKPKLEWKKPKIYTLNIYKTNQDLGTVADGAGSYSAS